MKIQVVGEAEQDLVDGFKFYEGRQTGLDDYFLNSIFSDIDSLQLFSGIHPMHFGYHRLLSKRFPFAIYYREEEGATRVYAVLDCRQDPDRIVKRLL